MAERLETHQGGILPWLNAWEHTSATSCQESGPLHKPARKDEEHGGQPAPFALVDQYEPSRKLPGMRLSGRATAAWAQDAKRVRTPGSARRGQHARVRAPGAVCQGSHAGGVVCQGQHARVRVPRAARQGPNAGGRVHVPARRGPRSSRTRSLGIAPIRSPRPPGLACQPARRAESPGHKKGAAPKSGAFPANYGRKPDPP